jgi:hypothetical protein
LGWISVSSPHSPAVVARHDAPLIGERAVTRRGSTSDGGEERFIVIDRQVVELGSFNHTAAAEKRNAENFLVLYEPAVAQQYQSFGRAVPGGRRKVDWL